MDFVRGIVHNILYLTSYFTWQNWLDKSGFVRAIFMYLSKALDCLPHHLIIAKLHAYGVDCDSLRLIRSYLSKLHERIKLNSVFSLCLQNITGVLQDSILSIFPRNIFLNNLLLTNLRSIVCNFSDNNTLYCCGETTEEVIENLQSDLKVVVWKNQTMGNFRKFPYMLLGKHKP